MPVYIREFTEADSHIVREIGEAQEIFPYDPSMTSAQAHDIWVEAP